MTGYGEMPQAWQTEGDGQAGARVSQLTWKQGASVRPPNMFVFTYVQKDDWKAVT